MRKPMVTIMLTTSCIIPVHDRVWSMDLGNPVDSLQGAFDSLQGALSTGLPRSIDHTSGRCMLSGRLNNESIRHHANLAPSSRRWH